MLQDVVRPSEHNPEEISNSPLSSQILEFYDYELFPQIIQNSEVASTSNYAYEDQYSNSYTTNQTTTTTTTTTPTTTAASSAPNLSLMFDVSEEVENDISASIDFTSSPPFSIDDFFSNPQFDPSLFQNQIQLPISDHDSTVPSQYYSECMGPPHHRMMGPPMTTLSEEHECLSSMPMYMRMDPPSPSCSVLDPNNSLNSHNFNGSLDSQNSGVYQMSMYQLQELEFQGDNGGFFFNQESLRGGYSSNEFQAPSTESQHMVNGGSSSTPLVSEITSFDESSFKVNKLSTEERKEKIHRYLKKRNHRNFSKTIKYACRKTLADSRPRVRGRFAKNDDLGDTVTRTTCSNHEEDTDEDARSNHVAVKEEEEMVDSSDIFAHISGLNSFKCNFPIQSWI